MINKLYQLNYKHFYLCCLSNFHMNHKE